MEIEGKVMATRKEKWDGRSRPSDDNYRKNFDRIFGKKEQEELDESYKQSLKNKKERTKTLNEELMEGFKKEQEELKDDVEHDHVNQDHATIKDKIK